MRDTAFLLAIVLLGGSLVFVAQRAADAGESLASARAKLALRKGEAKRQDARTEKQERLDSIAVRSKELMDVARAAGLTGTTDGQKQYEIGFSQGIKLAELQGELLQTRSQSGRLFVPHRVVLRELDGDVATQGRTPGVTHELTLVGRALLVAGDLAPLAAQ